MHLHHPQPLQWYLHIPSNDRLTTNRHESNKFVCTQPTVLRNSDRVMIGKTFWIRHKAHSSGAFTRNEGYRNCYYKSANEHTGSPLTPHLGVYRSLYIHITKAIVCYDSTHYNAVSTVFPSITIFLKSTKINTERFNGDGFIHMFTKVGDSASHING